MKHTILMAISGLALLAGCTSGQPKMNCNLAHGSYAAKYTRVGNLTGPAGSRCDRAGDVIGLQKYTDDEGRGRVFIVPLEIGAFNFYAAERTPIGGEDMAIGVMNDVKPDDNDTCSIASFETAIAREHAGADGTLQYEFSDMSFIVRPDVPGTIGSFTVKITDADCSATYEGVMMFPVVTCGNLADGAPVQARCAEADHYYTGLALNPHFDVTCRKNEAMTVLAEQYYYGPGTAGARAISSICEPADPNNLFCPDSGCDWRPEEE